MVIAKIFSRIISAGYSYLSTRTRVELDLTDQNGVGEFIKREFPDYIFLAAAKEK